MVRNKNPSLFTSGLCSWRSRFVPIGGLVIVGALIFGGGKCFIRGTTTRIRENMTITTTSLPTHATSQASRPRSSLFDRLPRVTSQPDLESHVMREKSRVLSRVANEVTRHRDFDRDTQVDIHTIDEDNVTRKQDAAGTDNFIYGAGTGRSLGELKRYIYLQIDHFTRSSISYADVWSPEEGDSILVYRSDLSLLHVIPLADGKVDVVIDVRLRHFSSEFAKSTEIDEDQFDIFLRMQDAHTLHVSELTPEDIRPLIDWYEDNLRMIEYATYRDRDEITFRMQSLPYGEVKRMAQLILTEYLEEQFAMNPYERAGAH